MTSKRALAPAVVLALALLSGCSAQEPVTPPDVVSSPSASPVGDGKNDPTPPADPELDPSGSASANHDYFDFVNSRLLAATPDAKGRAIIENLVESGFDKSAMQVTSDRTTIGRDADTIQFSVRIGDECLIGQTGAAGYSSMVGPALGDGSCLIGRTRTIDW